MTAAPNDPTMKRGGGIDERLLRLVGPNAVAGGNGPAACGTYKGWQRHYRQQEESCGPCRLAKNEYQRAYRASNAAYRADQLRRKAARDRAGRRLAALYPTLFSALYAEELES